MKTQLPQHVAIVMDGNGRWAQQRGMQRVEGHQAGIRSVKAVIKACMEKHIQVLSLFAFSSENWSRPEQEVAFLMQLFLQTLEHEIAELHHNGVRLRFCGCREMLSFDIQKKMDDAEQLTAGNTAMTLNLALNYGGKWDVTQAVRRIAQQVASGHLALEDINESTVAHGLDTQGIPDPDLFIRTSGEHRLSNFFLWQLAYTELYFTPVLWPDFNEAEFEKALSGYAMRERRYGRTANQLLENDYV